MKQNLTAKFVEACSPGETRREIPDALLPGLYLVIQGKPSGAKSWAVRTRIGGRPAKITIGAYPKIKLGDARELAGRALRSVAEGLDPRQEKRLEKATTERAAKNTFNAVAIEFLDRHARENRESSRRETARILGFSPDPKDQKLWIAHGGGIAKRWGKKPVRDITRRDVIELLDTYTDRGSRVMANRALAAIRKLFNWAAGRDIISASPCAGVGRPTVEHARDRVLSDTELRLIWRACNDVGWAFGPLVQLLILTGQRKMEVGKMALREFDLPEKTWTIPAARAKNGVEHTVHLSVPAIDILDSLPVIKGKPRFVFTLDGERPLNGYSKLKTKLDAAVAKLMAEDAAKRRANEEPQAIKPWRLHDIRRTVATGMARLGIGLPVVEKIMNHISGSFGGVRGVYQKHDFREESRVALDTWANFITALMSDKHDSNVVAIRNHAATR